MTIVERAKAPTPKFFRVLRSVGMALLAISGSIIAAPVVLPTVVVTVAGYVAVAGGVLSAVSQLTTESSVTLIPQAPEGGTEVNSEEEPFDCAEDNTDEALKQVQGKYDGD